MSWETLQSHLDTNFKQIIVKKEDLPGGKLHKRKIDFLKWFFGFGDKTQRCRATYQSGIKQQYDRRSFEDLYYLMNNMYKTKTTITKLARLIYKIYEEGITVEMGGCYRTLYPYPCVQAGKLVFMLGNLMSKPMKWDRWITAKQQVYKDKLSYNIFMELVQHKYEISS